MSKKDKEQAAKAAAEEKLEQVVQAAEKPEEEKTGDSVPDYYEQFVRLSADFENFRKRTEREKAAFLSYGKQQFAEKLLPAYEVLLRQKDLMEKKESSDNNCAEELQAVKNGLTLVFKELEKAFQAEGIERMDVLEKPYDPQTQEVVAMIPADKKQDGLVLQEVQIGFMMDGKVLRPARVIVGQHTEK